MVKFKEAGVLLITCTSLVVLLASCSGEVMGKAKDGERWFLMYRCNGCHGNNGDDGKGPQLRPMSSNFNSFKRKIRASGSSIMPSYPKENIPDQDIADMYAFLTSEKK